MHPRIISDDDVIVPELLPTEPNKLPVIVPALSTPNVIIPEVNKIAGFVVGYDSAVSALLYRSEGFKEARNAKDADFFVFTGGADIDPALYNEKPISGTAFYRRRDEAELEWYANIPDGVLKFGICRGAQLLNVLSGGSLYQDVDGHHKPHQIYDLRTKKLIRSSSIHHQMMLVGEGGVTLATANESTWRFTQDKKFQLITDFKSWTDPEVVWYEETNSLGVQGHPEYSGSDSEYGKYCMGLVKEFFYGPHIDDDIDDIFPSIPIIS
jgi:putative glutamine amidotransferase